MLPTQILDEFCTANTIPLPSYAEDGSNCVINDEMYTITEFGMLLNIQLLHKAVTRLFTRYIQRPNTHFALDIDVCDQ